MGTIRPFTEADIDGVAILHRLVFPLLRGASPDLLEEHRRYFRAVFLNHPWTSTGLSSLVFEGDDGSIGGFLGVVPRPLRHNDEELTAAISTQLVVHPDLRSKLIGVGLMRAFLADKQDISIADEATHEARRLWERLGGNALALESVSWTKVLRPATHLLRRICQRRWLRWASMARPIAWLLDKVAASSRRSAFSPKGAENVTSTPLATADLHQWLTERGTQRPIRSRYTLGELEWLLSRDAHRRGSLIRRAVRGLEVGPCGCYVYFMEANGTAEVVYFAALAGMATAVFQSLIADAHAAGAIELWGRMEADLITPVGEARCSFRRETRWVLVASQRPDLLQVLNQGSALLSKLEGEYPVRFK